MPAFKLPLTGLLLAVASGISFADAPQNPAPDAAAAASANKARSPATRHDCLHSTGSRIRSKNGDCLSLPGRAYGHEELEQTGGVTAAEQLRLSDPSVNVHGR